MVEEKVILLVQLLVHEDAVRLRNFLFPVERQASPDIIRGVAKRLPIEYGRQWKEKRENRGHNESWTTAVKRLVA